VLLGPGDRYPDDRARKAGAARAAENGATAHELMAIFGCLSLKEAERYTGGRSASAAISQRQQTARS